MRFLTVLVSAALAMTAQDAWSLYSDAVSFDVNCGQDGVCKDLYIYDQGLIKIFSDLYYSGRY
jgi:hypothetical protein